LTDGNQDSEVNSKIIPVDIGDLWPQLGNYRADITLEVQQNIILANILPFINQE
jgi:hypothetical protein